MSVNGSHLVTSALVCHEESVHHQIANSTFFTTSALVLKFSAFLFLSLRYGITFRSIHDFSHIFAVDFEVASCKNIKYRDGAVVS